MKHNNIFIYLYIFRYIYIYIYILPNKKNKAHQWHSYTDNIKKNLA